MTFVKNVLELFGIIYLRFRPAPRVWCVWLVAVNAACLYFITHIEGQVVLAVTGLAVALQTLIYQRKGFVRILGSAHIMWIPMFAWMAARMDTISLDPQLSTWLLLLLATNLVSFIVDVIDTVRYVSGERAPYYNWYQA
ncbi:hypothetical protein [Ruegeria arenilitoris]|uniref:hypothetical protein n=1 Tax=Ruegeria arenilitoris TaxID=1173585 RepID=UPI00147E6F1F|nr:hypothetical protein [Ruegeria arenilitoris]